ncbi:hypothetical protein CEUSTIGMA_g234.t1 [Chlamydomonas eustigma]|uniref:Uncharacterized protein n=1 Tax=Chlamydomonas eustigma TaxID=1157962 RepID=A0A250WPL8_9CHLO|nr:hypothetical protein CEUSTIGMA_g234.t1 [Chlamydomonas eustigma]|eukprot:GAX72778.1 hypothetical protein CEUSTIGMA_g234.t1 [Chlamydomonas eustigma]
MDVTRIIIEMSGALKANFSDGTILVLSSKGCNFLVKRECHQQRHLTDFALSRHAPALNMVLDFRNMHLDVPYINSKTLTTSREILTLGYHMRNIWWPSSVEMALSRGLLHMHADGKLALTTEDGTGKAVLHQLRRRMAVSYPLLVHEDAVIGAYQYVWHTQVFSIMACPPRWKAILELLIEAAGILETTDTRGRDMAVVGTTNKEETSSISTELPNALKDRHAGFQDTCPCHGWWTEQTLSLFPDGLPVVMEWTPQATYQFHASTSEVEAWLHHNDDMCLVTSRHGRFISNFRYHPNSGLTEQLYAAHCVPESVWDKGKRLPLATFAAHASKLRQQMATSLDSLLKTPEGTSFEMNCILGTPLRLTADFTCEREINDSPLLQPINPVSQLHMMKQLVEESFAVHSDTILDKAEIPGWGSFCAFEDGRLRAFFEDRTILHMNRTHTHCKVVTLEGHAILVSVSQPAGVEGYVDASLAYISRVWKSPQQRLQERQQSSRIEVELLALERTNCLLSWDQRSPLLHLGSADKQRQTVEERGVCSEDFCSTDVEAMLEKNRLLVNKL